MCRDRESVRRVDLRQLVDDHHVTEDVETRASEFLRPGYAEEAQFAHALDGWPGEFGLCVVMRGDGCDFIARECPDRFANGEVLLGEVEVVVHNCWIEARGLSLEKSWLLR